MPWLFRANGRRVTFARRAALVGNDSLAVVTLALAGGGVTQCALYHALPHVQAGAVEVAVGRHA